MACSLVAEGPELTNTAGELPVIIQASYGALDSLNMLEFWLVTSQGQGLSRSTWTWQSLENDNISQISLI